VIPENQSSHRRANPQNKSELTDWPYRPATSHPANLHPLQTATAETPSHHSYPAHATSATSPSETLSGTAREPFSTNSPVDHFRQNADVTQNAGYAGLDSSTQPIAHEHGATSSDLLNPALAFGTLPVNGRSDATGFQTNAQPQSAAGSFESQQHGPNNNRFGSTPPQNSLSRLTNPFGSAPTRSTIAPAPVLPSARQPVFAAPAPSLANLPAPQPAPSSQSTPPQPQNILEAGHAGAGHQVIHAYAESITPRNFVTVGQWSGTQTRPVQSIQQVSFDSCPDCEDVQRIPAESLINPYVARANDYPDSAALPRQNGQLVELPRDYAPWWEEVINKPLRAAPATHPINVESLILAAIEYSPQVTAFRIDPIIRETQILEEAAEFDWQSFIETKFADSNDPIGNSLTTGDNSDRFTDKHLTSRLGLEKRLAQGGKVDVAQNFGLQNNNSTFFTPTQQGTSRIELSFTQPLLRGAGANYNQSRTVLAMLDHQVSEDELQGSLQDHLLEVYATYWNLYRARAVRLQKERLLQRAIEVEQKLSARQGIDSVRRQVLRARAAIASRRSEIARADMEVRNSESRLRLLVNSPDLKRNTIIELLPVEAPMSEYLSVSMRGSVETALQNRPDIRRAITLMKETAVRLDVSKNELLPKLDLVLETYVAGLRGRNQVDTAWTNQFSEGRPGYTVGLTLQFPLGNRAAKARYAKREWEVARTLKQFEASVETSLTEVELAVRELETSYQEMLSRFQSMLAADTEANYLLERWRLLPGNDQTTSFLLEDMLDAQERVAMEEQDFVEAQVAYVLSVVRLKRASGILLSCDCGNSPVSSMTPTPRDSTQPKQLPQPFNQLPAPLPPRANSTPPLPILPTPESLPDSRRINRLDLPRPSSIHESGYSEIPMAGPAR